MPSAQSALQMSRYLFATCLLGPDAWAWCSESDRRKGRQLSRMDRRRLRTADRRRDPEHELVVEISTVNDRL